MKASKRQNPAYPDKLSTLGDHLRKIRLDRGLTQLDVARILNVTSDTIYKWESNLFPPLPKHSNNIMIFLGYVPFEESYQKFHELIRAARIQKGDNLKEAALKIGCDPTALSRIEKNLVNPHANTRSKIEKYIHSQKI